MLPDAEAINHAYELALKRYDRTIATFARTTVDQIPDMDVEDIEQELRIVLYRCVQRYDPNLGGSFNTLFQGCARNRCINFIRHNRTQSRSALVSSLSSEAVAYEVDALMRRAQRSAEDEVLASFGTISAWRHETYTVPFFDKDIGEEGEWVEVVRLGRRVEKVEVMYTGEVIGLGRVG